MKSMTRGGKMSELDDKQDDLQEQPEIEAMKLELEKIKLEKEKIENDLKSRTVALNKIAKEKQEKELANKTAEEQLEEFKKQVKSFEQKEAFRQSFKDVGLNPDDFQEIVNETDPKVQALKFSELLKAQTAKSAEVALEEFKKKQLENVTPEPKPQSDLQDDAFTQGLKKGLGG